MSFAAKKKVVGFSRVRVFFSIFGEVLIKLQVYTTTGVNNLLYLSGSHHQLFRKISFFCVPGIYTEIHRSVCWLFSVTCRLYFVMCSILYLFHGTCIRVLEAFLLVHSVVIFLPF